MPSVHIMIELCYISFDQWEIKIHLFQCSSLVKKPLDWCEIATHWRAKSKTRVGMVWSKQIILETIAGVLAQPTFQLVQWFFKNLSNQFHVSFYFSFRWFGWKAFVLNSSRANQFPWRKRSCTNYRITRHSDDNYVPFNLLEWIQRLPQKQEW